MCNRPTYLISKNIKPQKSSPRWWCNEATPFIFQNIWLFIQSVFFSWKSAILKLIFYYNRGRLVLCRIQNILFLIRKWKGFYQLSTRKLFRISIVGSSILYKRMSWPWHGYPKNILLLLMLNWRENTVSCHVEPRPRSSKIKLVSVSSRPITQRPNTLMFCFWKHHRTSTQHRRLRLCS